METLHTHDGKFVEKTDPAGEESPEGTQVNEAGREGSRQHGIFHGGFDSDEPAPHLHAKTFAAVLAICCLYFTQNFCIVGAGAVS